MEDKLYEIGEESNKVLDARGFPQHLPFPHAIAAIHSEVSEAYEWWRKKNPESDHIPGYTGVEEELADVIILVAGIAHAEGYRLDEAVAAKLKYNTTRGKGK